MKKYYSFLGFLDSVTHRLADKHLFPRRTQRWICDAFDYQISGGDIGQQNFPLNLRKLKEEDVWEPFGEPIKRNK